MTPKDKAKELFDKYYIVCQEFTEEIQCSIQAKQCALIAVNEIINSMPTYPQSSNSKMKRLDTITFWMLVKEERTYGGNK
jgi:hypothetical protein